MKISHRYLLCSVLACMICFSAFSQGFTNKGKEFWVGYGHHQFMEQSNNTQEMTIYLATGDSAAVVTLQIDSSGPTPATSWARTYTIPPNTAISISDSMPAGVTITKSNSCIQAIGPIPKGGPTDCGFDARLYTCPYPACSGSEGLFRKKAIHITSSSPIVAYAHIYGSVSSGATMLIPVEAWGYEYTSVNSDQNNASDAFSWMYIIAGYNNTLIRITPSVPLRNGRPAGVSFDTVLQKGQIFQLLAKLDVGVNPSSGFNLTGTTVKSIDNGTGVIRPIAVFSGSSRTGGEPPCNTGGRDNDMQQVFPQETWGKQYLTAPFSNSAVSSSLMQCVYKVMVTDPTTIVKVNGIKQTGLIANKYYKFASSTADYITADKPVMVAQYMGGGCLTGDGDPEMVYLSPLSQGINKTRFYRSYKEFISVNYLTLIIPTGGVGSLKIDGQFFANIPLSEKYSYVHPNKPDYTVVVKRWTAASAQCFVESLIPFTGVTYGEGGAESYGYNIGAYFDSVGKAYNSLSGYIFLDKNKNGVKDSIDSYFNNATIVTTRPNTDTFATITSTGRFYLLADTGAYITKVVPYKPYYNVVPATYTTNFMAAYHQDDSIAFALQPLSAIRDLSVNIIPLTPVRQARNVAYEIIYQNQGTDTADGTVKMVKNSRLVFVSASPMPDAINNDSLTWNFAGLAPDEVRRFILYFSSNLVNPINAGDTLTSTVAIESNASDVAPADNMANIKQVVVGAYDPNDKVENHGGRISSLDVSNGEYLQYTVRFQNTGNDTAFKVVIKDTLDNKLDWSSIRMISSSHNYQLTISDQRYLVWNFDKINLVDSNTNEPQSHGYITFIIKPKTTLVLGDTIKNRAAIYFDFNPAIMTNVEKTVVTDLALPLYLLSFTARKESTSNLLEWTTSNEINVNHFDIERGVLSGNTPKEFKTIGIVKAGAGHYQFIDNSPLKTTNYYRLKMIDRDGQFTYSPVRKLNNSGNLDVSLYPNPAKDKLHLQFESKKPLHLKVQIIGLDGKLIETRSLSVGAGSTIQSIGISKLSPGVVYLKIFSSEGDELVFRFEKI